MTTLFISDLHLDASRPDITRLFVDFVRGEAIHAKALYILGDLFEAWIGDDVEDETAAQVADALAELHAHRVPCFYIHGNRDFLLGDAYARRARMTLLPDPSVVEIEGERVLLMHGDTLCVDDVAYQGFRIQSRTADWQSTFLQRPVTERQAFAAQARAESRRYTRSVDEAITDVNTGAVLDAIRTHEVRRVIHGHTHRPAMHRLSSGELPCERIVLGDWYQQTSALRIECRKLTLSIGKQELVSTLSPQHSNIQSP
ncbi:UDP-2,3-diacylglucosamine diphosphatase [Dokdonella sp.]|uniref:UDP-2,3-diacylglucosamine diphosphatase n=1 Tax=Dokdonella sp. TaxID=2291710 RepID=UPI001B149AA5|nr:UDP-2,3-diacylglucosamine diphosphatase [Dokdonella sp.]MBO9662359.1 UDP-2,3-diacylglucosamine diphosphatase [Dokdonella sp.]